MMLKLRPMGLLTASTMLSSRGHLPKRSPRSQDHRIATAHWAGVPVRRPSALEQFIAPERLFKRVLLQFQDEKPFGWDGTCQSSQNKEGYARAKRLEATFCCQSTRVVLDAYLAFAICRVMRRTGSHDTRILYQRKLSLQLINVGLQYFQPACVESQYQNITKLQLIL